MKIFYILFCLVLNVSWAKTPTLKIYADDSYAPFSYVEDGKLKGMDVEIVKEVLKGIKKYKVELIGAPWKRGKAYMKQGKGLGLLPPYFHGHDWPYLYPYSLGLYEETVLVICNSKTLSQEKLKNWPNDFIGLSVGNASGYDGWGGAEFHKLVKNKKINYNEVKTLRQLILQSVSGRINCFLAEKTVFKVERNKLLKERPKLSKSLKGLKPMATTGKDYVHIGYSKQYLKENPEHRDFLQLFDSEFYRKSKSGEIDKIIQKYNQ